MNQSMGFVVPLSRGGWLLVSGLYSPDLPAVPSALCLQDGLRTCHELQHGRGTATVISMSAWFSQTASPPLLPATLPHYPEWAVPPEPVSAQRVSLRREPMHQAIYHPLLPAVIN
ncbi:hypothetical protein DPEC_G00270100 [Dallia pectoralis]|uniref:Uncharacterized protein n=1 Tax=Dallia pectoralis TaxID=75939 RepID=A0ACC2FPE9_DALPE|nr:hypothetical protein DPEC_G00270100 [Dallia pectoralis]